VRTNVREFSLKVHESAFCVSACESACESDWERVRVEVRVRVV
jgi:hypothetical protein